MNDAPLFKGFPAPAMGAFQFPALASSWPMALARIYWVELPMAVTGHIQRFMAQQGQERMRLLSELSCADSVSGAFNKEMAFLQQTALAWGVEMMEILELCQEKLVNPIHEDQGMTNVETKKAA